MKSGCLIISLDFELLWGTIESWTPEGYGKSHVNQVKDVIPRLIKLFDKYGVKATFATVGFVMLNGVDDIKHHMPKLCPSYKNLRLLPYGDYMQKIRESDSHLYFAPQLIQLLQKSNNIEIGSHTFSHFYCWEEGLSIEQFDADMEMAQLVAKSKGIQLKSIVFPRNQITNDCLSVCAKHGIQTFRGNPTKFFGKPKNRWEECFYRFARFVDTYINLSGNTSHPYSSIKINQEPMNVPASRMLRPYMSYLRLFDDLKLLRIKREMRYAAKHHELYHLWWHPHNFGANMDQNFTFLEKVLRCYQECKESDGMLSLTMSDFYRFMKS